MKIAGVDYSMTSPSITVFDGKSYFFHYFARSKKYQLKNKQFRYYEYPDYTSDQERYHLLSDWAIKILSKCNSVILEGYSFGSKGQVFNIAENTELLKYKLWMMKKEYSVIAPTSLKKYATGKGNSDKNIMYQHFYKNTNIDLLKLFCIDKVKNISSPISDICDSYFLCKNLKEKLKL